MRPTRIALFLALAFFGCANTQHISRFDQTITTGLTTARTALSHWY